MSIDLKTVQPISGFVSDHRNLKSGDVFVALKGETVDGHQFIEQALRAGAKFAVVNQQFAKTQSNKNFIVVDDTVSAHRELAALARQNFKGSLLAVGGSNGKTSTKEFFYQFLAPLQKTIKTYKSQNGEQGLPKTFEQLRDDVKWAIIEVGIDRPGDMARHMELVQPDIAVLTSIGEEHLNLFKNIETVFNEEIKMFDATLKRGGKCFAPSDDLWLKKYSQSSNVQWIDMNIPKSFQVPFEHPMAQRNAWLAYSILCKLGFSKQDLDALVPKLIVADNRGAIENLGPWQIICDFYNANPASMKVALQMTTDLSKQRSLPATLILGDMFDLGSSAQESHQSLIPNIQAVKAEKIFLVGPFMSELKTSLPLAQCFENTEQAAIQLGTLAKKSPQIVLMKASRGMEFEKIFQALKGAKNG